MIPQVITHPDEIRIEYKQTHPMYWTSYGKSWAKHTQCLIFKNGLLVGKGLVVKHAKDPDNDAYAIKAATKKAMAETTRIHKRTRTEIWKLIDNYIKELEHG